MWVAHKLFKSVDSLMGAEADISPPSERLFFSAGPWITGCAVLKGFTGLFTRSKRGDQNHFLTNKLDKLYDDMVEGAAIGASVCSITTAAEIALLKLRLRVPPDAIRPASLALGGFTTSLVQARSLPKAILAGVGLAASGFMVNNDSMWENIVAPAKLRVELQYANVMKRLRTPPRICQMGDCPTTKLVKKVQRLLQTPQQL